MIWINDYIFLVRQLFSIMFFLNSRWFGSMSTFASLTTSFMIRVNDYLSKWIVCAALWLCVRLTLYFRVLGLAQAQHRWVCGKKKGRAEEVLNQLIEVEGWKQNRDDNGKWTGFLSATGKGWPPSSRPVWDNGFRSWTWCRNCCWHR